MSLWNLTVSEQTGVTGALLNPKVLRPRFQATPLLAAMLPGLDQVHAQVATFAPARNAEAAERELGALSEEGNALDVGTHDRLVRALFRLCDGLAEAAEGPDEAERLRAMSARVLPQGLATGQQSWIGEAGNAARLEAELDGDPAFRASLAAIPLPGGRTLLTLVEELVAAGQRLGAIELRRAELRRAIAANAPAEGDDASAKEGVTLSAARKAWVDTVETLRGVLRMAQSPVDADVRDAVLSLLDDAEKRADARARTRVAARKGDDPVVTKASKAAPAPGNGAAKSVPPPAKPS
ncbi:MAG: hypothetical protein U0324_06005 [Polyangiales bacterium]